MDIGEITQRAREQLVTITKLPLVGVIGTVRDDKGWVVTVEMLEKKSIPDGMDVLGIYEVKLNEQGQLADFQRIKLRRRSDTVEA